MGNTRRISASSSEPPRARRKSGDVSLIRLEDKLVKKRSVNAGGLLQMTAVLLFSARSSRVTDQVLTPDTRVSGVFVQQFKHT